MDHQALPPPLNQNHPQTIPGVTGDLDVTLKIIVALGGARFYGVLWANHDLHGISKVVCQLALSKGDLLILELGLQWLEMPLLRLGPYLSQKPNNLHCYPGRPRHVFVVIAGEHQGTQHDVLGIIEIDHILRLVLGLAQGR